MGNFTAGNSLGEGFGQVYNAVKSIYGHFKSSKKRKKHRKLKAKLRREAFAKDLISARRQGYGTASVVYGHVPSSAHKVLGSSINRREVYG